MDLNDSQKSPWRKDYSSWGGTFHFKHLVDLPQKASDLKEVLAGNNILPYGYGLSYGDVCLNDGGTLVDISPLGRAISFEPNSGVLHAEAGLRMRDVLQIGLPHGWFLPVTPGTQGVSLGGAIANDVHGKNHHIEGTMGRHIIEMNLWRSDGSKTLLSPNTNQEMFAATVGGMGLTGIISDVKLQLKKGSGWITTETIKFESLDEFDAISRSSDESFEYTVAWVDCLWSKGLRGHFMRGNHAEGIHRPCYSQAEKMAVRMFAPQFLLNSWAIKSFNSLYYNRQIGKTKKATVHYEPFFYPLDMISGWNKLYGKAGFFQYQFVIPLSEKEALLEILRLIRNSGQGSFLAVLKKFGEVGSPGLLSFPQPGYTLALDFPNRGQSTARLFRSLDQVVFDAGGRLYPAKDSHMSAEMFQKSYPRWEEFLKYKDPKFSSSFLRRISA